MPHHCPSEYMFIYHPKVQQWKFSKNGRKEHIIKWTSTETINELLYEKYVLEHSYIHKLPWFYWSNMEIILFYLFLPLIVFITKISFLFKFSFQTLCLCLQYFHNNFLLLNKESMLDPVTDTFSTYESTTLMDTADTDVFFHFRQPHFNITVS